MKHGKYSKTKEVRPYKVSVIIKRYDGDWVDEYFFKTEQQAKQFIDFDKEYAPKPNQYYFGTEYKIQFIGTEKYI